MTITWVGRQVKHAAFVAIKRARPLAVDAYHHIFDIYAQRRTSGRTFRFQPSRYRRSFLVRDLGPRQAIGDFVPRVFCFWTGDNEMSPNRVRNLQRLQESVGVPVHLITSQNLDEWMVGDWPFHPSYEYLSLVHRSDYLRAYFLHHHGGGYCDLKEPTARWDRVLTEIEGDPTVWYVGAPHRSSGHVAKLPGTLGSDLRLWHRSIPGNLACLCRSHTPLTLEWLTEVERRLDYYLPQLREFPGGERGEVVGYPISWNRLLNQVHHPLTLKHHVHVRTDARIDVISLNYR